MGKRIFPHIVNIGLEKRDILLSILFSLLACRLNRHRRNDDRKYRETDKNNHKESGHISCEYTAFRAALFHNDLPFNLP